MSNNAEPLERLIEQFSKFPGVGRKGATRMAYQVLSMQPEQAMELSKAIQDAHHFVESNSPRLAGAG